MTDTVCAYLLGSEPATRENLARQLGKKGTSSDVCLYNYDKDFTLEVVDPLRYPEKPLAMFQTIFMTDVPIVLIPITGPDIHTAEFGLLLESLGFENVFMKENILIVLKLSRKSKKCFLIFS
jgi:selenocysteine-specific translation elongation factor